MKILVKANLDYDLFEYCIVESEEEFNNYVNDLREYGKILRTNRDYDMYSYILEKYGCETYQSLLNLEEILCEGNSHMDYRVINYLINYEKFTHSLSSNVTYVVSKVIYEDDTTEFCLFRSLDDYYAYADFKRGKNPKLGKLNYDCITDDINLIELSYSGYVCFKILNLKITK